MNDQAFQLLKSDIIHLRSEVKALRKENRELRTEVIGKLDQVLEFKWKLTGIVSFLTVAGTFVARMIL